MAKLWIAASSSSSSVRERQTKTLREESSVHGTAVATAVLAEAVRGGAPGGGEEGRREAGLGSEEGPYQSSEGFGT